MAMSEYIKWSNPVKVGIKDLYCLEKAYRLSQLTVRDFTRIALDKLGLWVLGAEVHSVLQFGEGCRKEVKVQCCDMTFRIDAVCNNTVIEVKMSLNERYRNWYLWTLRKYMCMWAVMNGLEEVRGVLIGILDQRQVEMYMKKEDIEKECRELEEIIRKFREGIREKNVGSHCTVCIFKNQCLNKTLDLY